MLTDYPLSLVCITRSPRGHLRDQPLPIFVHALRYRRVNLVNQSAVYLSRKPLFSVLDHIPSTFTVPWVSAHS